MWIGTLFGFVLMGQAAVMIYSVACFVRWHKKAMATSVAPAGAPEDAMSVVVITARLAPAELADVAEVIALCDMGHEVLFCAESPDEASAQWLSGHPAVSQSRAKWIYYDGPFGPNPKADMMRCGLRAAQHDLVVFIDGNALAGPRLDQRILTALHNGAALVTTLPTAQSDGGFWANVEASLLTNIYARWMAAGDTVGIDAAFGKLLAFRQSWLAQNGGADRLDDFKAEDTALWRIAAKEGAKTRYVSPAVNAQLIQRSALATVARATRWHKLRRADLPLVFAAESLYAFWGLMTVGLTAAAYHNYDVAWTFVAITVFWHSLEALINLGTGQGWRPVMHVQILVRDALQCYCWWAAFFSKSYIWRQP